MNAKNYTAVDHLVDSKKQDENEVIASLAKEAEPALPTKELPGLHEVAEHEEIDEEVKPYVQHKHETIKLPDIAKQAGAVAAPPTHFPTYDQVKIPLTDEKVIEGMKKPVTSSFRWLAELCIYLLKQAHLTVQSVQGKTTRVKVGTNH